MPKLSKGLKLIDIFSIAAGAMVSAGIFILPGIAYQKCGASVIFVYFIAGILSIPGVISIAELVTAMPKAGGGYFFVTRSLGAGVGTIAGVLSWLSLIFKTTFALVGLATYVSLIVSINSHIVGILVCTAFLAINYFGIKKAGRVQVFLVLILFLILIFYIIYGARFIDVNNYTPFLKGGLQNIISTTGFIFVSYGGLLKVASLAEEVEDSKKLPKGMLTALGIICIVYTALVFVTVGVLNGDILSKSITPISDGGFAVLGVKGKILLSVAAIIGFISASNVGIMSASRYPYALSQDQMFPALFKKVSKKFKTPYWSIFITGLIIIIGLFLKLNILIEVASTSLILTYILANISIIIMRESKLINYKPQYKAPFYPYVQILGIILYSFLIFEIGKEALIATMFFIFVSIVVYFFYGRKRKQKEFALLHVIERVIDKNITGTSLEKELRKILRERDSIKEDQFDKIIKKCVVLDFNEKINYKDVYETVSKKLTKRLNMSEKKIFSMLMDKEKKYSSVISETVAIPHIVIKGKNKFEMVIIRGKKGIEYPDEKTPVIVFILLGTIDKRNFHLKALSAIAQIIHNRNFKENWLNAKNKDVLKEIILMSRRERF
jgi:amino acid transporter/mannitol/fructose-specific phosphotransferase system IIA component (Ntr-type)